MKRKTCLVFIIVVAGISLFACAAPSSQTSGPAIPSRQMISPTQIPHPTEVASTPTGAIAPTADHTPPTIQITQVLAKQICYVTNNSTTMAAGQKQLLVVYAQIDDPAGINIAYLNSRYMSSGGYISDWAKVPGEGQTNGIYIFSVAPIPAGGLYDTQFWDNRVNWTGSVQYQIFARNKAENVGSTAIQSLPFKYNCG